MPERPGGCFAQIGPVRLCPRKAEEVMPCGTVGSRQSAVGSGQSETGRLGDWETRRGETGRPGDRETPQLRFLPCLLVSLSPRLPVSPSPRSVRRGFTLVELLVTISIIGIMAALTMGVVHSARQMAAEAATKATIAKLNAIIMKRYESLSHPKGAGESLHGHKRESSRPDPDRRRSPLRHPRHHADGNAGSFVRHYRRSDHVERTPDGERFAARPKQTL